MQNLHVGLSLAKHRVLEYVDILDALIFHKVREAFLLYTCHIQDVGIGNDVLVEVGVLYIFDAMLLAINLVLIGHSQLLRRYEMECRVEVAHGCDERMYGTAILEVAYKIYVKIVESALGLIDRVEVEQTL